MKIFVPFSMLLPVLIELFRENNSFTHTSQALFAVNEVKPEFDKDQNDILKVTFYNNQYDIFYYRIKEENGIKEIRITQILTIM
ncbi:hypothetical protein THOM_0021 [Trachipleistophora hominis]|uniref:Uncharacterized protein n=1 Tax=Trachipleistophora hominis TaxID=72359 RepID=L7JZX5_TRAHO|nr:hypothetical protein THOM_0021 [Trachipleistophora hominis]